jgi:hypothetical protein
MDGADRTRESLDMVEILASVGAQRVERQPPFGPGLIERMLEHGPIGDLRIDPL